MKKKIISIFIIQIIMILGITDSCFAVGGVNETNPSKPAQSTSPTITGNYVPDNSNPPKKNEKNKNNEENEENEEIVIQKNFNPNDWKPKDTTGVTNATKLKSAGNIIIGAIRTIGSILSVIVLVIIGIKYMIGSVEEKAEYKRTMLPYVIGAVMVFGITNLLGIVVNLTKTLVK